MSLLLYSVTYLSPGYLGICYILASKITAPGAGPVRTLGHTVKGSQFHSVWWSNSVADTSVTDIILNN